MAQRTAVQTADTDLSGATDGLERHDALARTPGCPPWCDSPHALDIDTTHWFDAQAVRTVDERDVYVSLKQEKEDALPTALLQGDDVATLEFTVRAAEELRDRLTAVLIVLKGGQ